MHSVRMFLISYEETSSPLSVCIASEKSCLSGRMPNCVWTYLLFTTREMVETSRPVRSAMSLRIIGRSFDWSPSMK